MAGARWTGAKTTFDEDEAQPEAAAAPDTQSPQEGRPLPAAQLPASLKAVKWKKLVTAELQQVKHRHTILWHVFIVMCQYVKRQPLLSAAQPGIVWKATALALSLDCLLKGDKATYQLGSWLAWSCAVGLLRL